MSDLKLAEFQRAAVAGDGFVQLAQPFQGGALLDEGLCVAGIKRQDLVEALGVQDLDIKVAAVCVYHNLVPVAVDALEGSGIPVAAVSTGFPAGQISFEELVEGLGFAHLRTPNEFDRRFRVHAVVCSSLFGF